jgi:hypothetical protein
VGRRFRYYLKLYDGRMVYGEGESWEEAAKEARVKLADVKRCMPVEALKTPEEIQASRERVARMLQKKERQDDSGE